MLFSSFSCRWPFGTRLDQVDMAGYLVAEREARDDDLNSHKTVVQRLRKLYGG